MIRNDCSIGYGVNFRVCSLGNAASLVTNCGEISLTKNGGFRAGLFLGTRTRCGDAPGGIFRR